jgi:hypothetical protein
MTEVFTKYKDDNHALVSVLQEAQDIYGYLPTDVIYLIAQKLGVSPAKVMGVATFYSQFRLKKASIIYVILSALRLLMITITTSVKSTTLFRPVPTMYMKLRPIMENTIFFR